MKKIIILLLLSSLNNSYAQNPKGYCVTKNNDTIFCEFDKTDDLFLLGEKKIKIINLKGEKITFSPLELNSFTLSNIQGSQFNYLSTIANSYKTFLLVEIEGKISVFKSYSRNMNGLIEKTLFCKDNLITSRETNFFNFRNWFGKFIEDYPELYMKWMDSNNFYKKNEVFQVIKLYNEHFKQ